ncbi:MAG: LysM peptidoglycan-binding domain-containing protein [Verrucomicrobia bacterium]|nr:LysM peptidoglycan-binding domain-containing protein [Verrucomicrobiota bacterium]
MKSKKIRFQILALQLVVLAGFLLTQGCATGACPVDWLNWPYGQPVDEPLILPADDYMVDTTDAILLPPDIYTSAPYEAAVELPGQVYVVKKGDTLSTIASMYGTTWKKLAEYNSLSNPNKLLVGQKINIPGSLDSAPAPIIRSSSPTASVKAAASPIKQGASYVIQKGDTLSGIAKRAGLTVDEIRAANALTGSQIIAGKSLSIPKKGEVSVTVLSDVASKPVTIKVEAPVLAPMAELAPIAEAAPVDTATSAPVYEHVLYPGETLEDVARQYGSSKEEIMTLNGIADPASVKPGTKLLVPIPE